MARNRRKIPLYEVIKARPKSSYGKTLEQLHEKKPDEDVPTAATSADETPERPIKWPRRPKIIQFNAGRIEISMSYPLVIALLLGFVLLVLVVFRLGQFTYAGKGEIADLSGEMSMREVAGGSTAGQTQTPEQLGEASLDIPASAEKVRSVRPKGNNRIVIQTYQVRADLEPVKQYFANFGIETEIRKIDDWYYLVTKNKYENPERPGTDGYLVEQKIIELGAKYEAPQGYETFGTKPFHDAYGKRFDD
jgi:hypothetical protein